MGLTPDITAQSEETERKQNQIHLCAFFAILLLGLTVRLIYIFQPMRYDEAFSFTNYASTPLSLALSSYSYPNNHLFHTLLVHIAHSVLGNRPWVIRLPALVAGVLLIPASYLVTRILYNKSAALLSAAMVASSSILIEYSSNARGYTSVSLIFLVTLALGTVLTHQLNLTAWMSLGILFAIGFYTIPIMLYPFGIVALWLFLSIIFEESSLRRCRLFQRLFVSIAMGALLTSILYLPVFAVSGFESVFANRFVAPMSWAAFAAQFPPSLLSVWNLWNRDVPGGISYLFVVGFFASLIFHKRVSHYRVPVASAVVLWLFPVLAAQRVVPFARVWLFLLPLYVGLASAGVSYFFRANGSSPANSIRFAIGALGLALWLSFSVVSNQSVYYSNETGTLRDAEAITVFLKAYMKPGDRVLASVPSDAPLIYYFNLHQVPVEYFMADLASSKRIVVVVNESNDQTLNGLLGKIGSLAGPLGVPRLVRRYESAALYEINRPR